MCYACQNYKFTNDEPVLPPRRTAAICCEGDTVVVDGECVVVVVMLVEQDAKLGYWGPDKQSSQGI